MKIVIVTTRFPYLLGSPDSFTVFNLIKYLSKKHEIILFSLLEEDVDDKYIRETKNLCNSIYVCKHSKLKGVFNVLTRFLNFKPLQVNYFFNSELKKKVEKYVHDNNPDLIYTHLLRAAPFVERLNDSKRVIGVQISHILNYKRLLNHSRSLRDKILYFIEYHLIKKYEPETISKYTKALLISKFDKDAIEEVSGEKIDNVFFSPHGIDVEYYSKSNLLQGVEKNENPTILFPANFSPATNQDAARWLVDDIYPKIKDRVPDAELILAGKNPPQFLYEAAQKDPSITVTGFVEDIRPYFVKSTLLVNPVRACAGMQNKVLSGFCMELPVIATYEANEGINAPEDIIELSSSKDSNEIVQKAVQLLQDKERRVLMAKNARNYVVKYWTWEYHFEQLEDMFSKL